MKQFTAKLKEKQGGMTGVAFAQKLGLDPAEWSRVKNGRNQPGKRMINAVLAVWPELAYWLAEDAKADKRNGEAA